MSARGLPGVPERFGARRDPPRPARRVPWTIADARGRVIASGVTPRPMTDREAIGWVLSGGPSDGTPPVLEPGAVYRVRAGDCAAVAEGRELAAVDRAATLDEHALMTPGKKHLHEPTPTANAHAAPAPSEHTIGAKRLALLVRELQLAADRLRGGTEALAIALVKNAFRCLPLNVRATFKLTNAGQRIIMIDLTNPSGWASSAVLGTHYQIGEIEVLAMLAGIGIFFS